VKYEEKTKEQLIAELTELRKRLAKLEREKAKYKQIELALQESEEFQQVQKIESVGLLTQGIAHDFNNLLLGITGYIALAKLFSTKEKVVECLTEAEEVAFQAKELIKQLLTLYNGEEPDKEVTNISDLLKGTAEFALRRSNAKYGFEIPDNLWMVEIDKAQISQVISNLIIYVDRAIYEESIINIKSQNVFISEDDNLPVERGNYVKIIIEAKGLEIPQSHLSKIFEPYFSSKGIGSGLTLAICPSILKNHDGYITVKSDIDGLSFYIYLPAFKEESPKETISKVSYEDIAAVIGEGKVLLMDDEKYVRKLAVDFLTHIGYEVEVAKDGVEAIKLYRKAQESEQPFDVVILDLTVPGGMGGKETIQKLLEIDANVKAIVSSGYSKDSIMSNYKEYGFTNVIAKPYSIRELNEILHKTIESIEDK